MSGAEPDFEANESIPPEDDPDLLDEVDTEEASESNKPRVRKKRRGGGSGGDSDIAKAKQRPFIESQVRQSLAKSDITETMNRWDWESGDYEVAVKRVQPQTHMGRNTYGFIASFMHAIDESFIHDNFGGGVYDLTVRGPHPKTGNKRSFLDGCRVKVAGPPRLSPMDPTAGAVVLSEPTSEMGAMTRQRKAQEAGGWTSVSGSNGGGSIDRGMDRMAFDAITNQAKKDREELSRLQNRFIEQVAKREEKPIPPPPDTSLQREALRMTQVVMEKASEAQRESSDKFERILERVGSQQQGIPPELLQSLSEQHRAEMTAQSISFQTQLSSERERFDREMGSTRDRYERELDQTRNMLQERIDRAQEEAKREVDRVRDEFGRRIEDGRKEADRSLQIERERAERDRQSERERSDRDRQSAESSHKMQIEHMKALHEGQVTQITSSHQSQLMQLISQHETSMKLAEASLQARISSLQAELDRTRSDLTSANAKIGEQGDLVQQATKLKTVGEALGGAFGLAPAGMMHHSSPMVDSSPAEPEVKGWLGTLMRFADSRLGENMFDFIKVAAASAAGMGPAIPSLPGQMQQQQAYGGMPPQYGQPMYPQAPPGYAPPQYGGTPVYATPVEEEYEEGEEGEEGEEEYEEGSEGEEGEDGQEEFEPEEPTVTSSVDGSGVVHGNVPYGRPIGANAEHQRRPSGKPKARPRPTAPPQQGGMPQMTPEEAAEQARALVQGVEEAMNDNTPPDQLAAMIAKVAPPDQLMPFATTPLSELVDKMVQVVPNTMLATFTGRQYLASLQNALKKVLQVSPS